MWKQWSVVVVLVAVYFAVVPVPWLLPPAYHLHPDFAPKVGMKDILPYSGPMPTPFLGQLPEVHIGPLGYLAVVEAKAVTDQSQYASGDALNTWYLDNMDWITHMTHEYGGILFRNFHVANAVEFDHLIGTIHPDMQAEIYLGTTLRLRINGTRFIQSASEAGKFASIPTHIELSFTPNPPKRIYFYADEINEAPGGHTPVTDFRAVWDELPKDLKEEIQRRGWLYERWYRHEQNKMNDPLKMKSWQDMFLTSNKTLVEELAHGQEFNVTWADNGDIVLRHYATISRTHSVTKREFWCTHFNVLHAPTFSVPFAWDAQILQSKQSVLFTWLMELWVQGRHKLLGHRYGHNTYWADDESELPWDVAMTIRKIISRNTWMFAYERGDVIVLDNHRMAHGRTPYYKGHRSVMVAYK